MSGAAVRAAFRDQAHHCRRLGSPFTALLCDTLAEGIDESTEPGRRVLGWSGDPSAFADSVPLRVAGGLHALVRAGAAPTLAACYPPNPAPEPPVLLYAALRAFAEHEAFLLRFLDNAPQTNEVGRACALLPGLLEIARTTSLPLDLYEIGASAGLNLFADRHAYRFGEHAWPPGPRPAGAAVELECRWSGAAPALDAALRIGSRQGCDVQPIDLRDAQQRARLIAYVWPDQTERLRRLRAAIDVALEAGPPAIERADAGEWLERQWAPPQPAGRVRVLVHSVVWGYLSGPTRERVLRALHRAGEAADASRPVGWLRLELVGTDRPAELRLTCWPGGEDRLLAHAHPHGSSVTWGA